MNILDLIYPPRCPVCDKICFTGICPDCLGKIHFIDKDYCMKCGKPLFSPREEFCDSCKRKKHYFDEARSLLLYDEDIKRAVYRLKYSRRRDIGASLGRECARHLAPWIKSRRIGRIVPVPLSKARVRERGFNQANVIAQALGKETDIFVDDKLLIRVKNTPALKKKSAAERGKILSGAFAVNPKLPKNYLQPGEAILVVDDIYTTGSTADEAVCCLKNIAPKTCKFYILCLATEY